jgi:RNA polymerase-binding transcription factor DksA
MTNIDPQHARERVEAEKARVEGLIREVSGELAGPSADEETQTDDPASHGSETFEREKDLAIVESLEHELAELEAALQRIDDGSYGIDEVTGEPIAPERLEARPAARTNVDSPNPPHRQEAP